MSEQPLDGHDVIHHGGEVVAVVVPMEEYRQLKDAAEVARGETEFAIGAADFLAREAAGTTQYVSSEEARRRLGLPLS
jgi:PHD/YefM family antitoxin component YafN of YafNO toxin-antitoxin module